MGRKCENQFASSLESVVDQLTETMTEKFRMYGNENILEDGKPGVYTRMKDKFHRLNNIMNGQNPNKTESEEDTWLDIAGYSIIGMMLTKGTWPGQSASLTPEMLEDALDRISDSVPTTEEGQCAGVAAYVAGPTDLSNCHWLVSVRDRLMGVKGLSCFYPQHSYTFTDKSGYQFVKDVNMLALSRSSIVIAFLPLLEYTVGTVFEIVMALHQHKKVFVVMDVTPTPIYLSHPDITVLKNLDQLVDELNRR